MLPNIGKGSIPVILSLWRFAHLHLMRNMKYVTSIEVLDVASEKNYELDFVLMLVDRFDYKCQLVLGEARSFKDFTKKDFGKMRKIAGKLQVDTYLSFSTLKDDFSASEKEQMGKLISEGFQVIAMTRKELDPYDLYKRFDKAPHKYAVNLDQFTENLTLLNIK
jgi:hypothetical protein